MTFIKQKQRTGNIKETVWDTGTTTWDVSAGTRTIWDKDTTEIWQKGKQSSTPTFLKQKQRTGNVQEMTWYDDDTYATEVTWDLAVAPVGQRMIWDKEVNTMWVKEKQGS